VEVSVTATRIIAAALAALTLAGGAAAQEDGRLTVELNKFEQAEGGCEAYFLFRNQTDMTLEGFEMSLAVLDPSGVIDSLLSIDAAPLPAQRTSVKLFEIPGTQCAAISEILLHELGSCRPAGGEEMDCFPILDLSSKTAAALVK
jgi:hypothetical protein